MSLLLEMSVVPVLGNTYKVNILLTVTVLCLSHQVICHTSKGWEFCHYILCFCNDLWCSKFRELNQFVPAEYLTHWLFV